jgi:pimeloyl-[acyl-carrier protein] methyl ester esterase
VKYVAKKLPQNEPIILLAESFSGPVAIEILKYGKIQIERAIFVATFAKSPRPGLLGLAKYLPLSWLLKLKLPTVLIRHFCLGKQASKEQIESFNKTINKVSPTVLAQRLKILATVDSTDALKGIKTPCCYLQALGDKLVPSGALKDFEKGIKGLKVKSVNGPHLILQTEPKKCVVAICEEAT